MDPLGEGVEDINEQIDDEYNDLEPLTDEDGVSWISRIKQKFGTNYKYAVRRIGDIFKTRNPEQNVPVYMELRNLDELEQHQDDAVTEIRSRYANPDTSKFISRTDEFGQVKIKLIRRGSKEWLLDDPKIPQTLKDYLGDTIQERIENLETANEAEGENPNEVERRNDEIQQLDERLSLRERIKLIFKKYGFTVFAIVSAVGVIIGVIINSLKGGLSSVTKGLGNGLKAIGKKLGEILPGMVGAIASFIFRTAGEVVGFLAKNAWLLIIAVVLYVVERYKKK